MFLEMLLISLFILGLAWPPCCTEVAPFACETCTGITPNTLNLILGSAADSQCDDCTSINGTHIITHGGTNPLKCEWRLWNTALACSNQDPADTSEYDITIKALLFSGSDRWHMAISMTHVDDPLFYATQGAYTWDSSGTSGFDCTIDRTLTEFSLGNTGSGHVCDLSSLTVEIEPN